MIISLQTDIVSAYKKNEKQKHLSIWGNDQVLSDVVD